MRGTEHLPSQTRARHEPRATSVLRPVTIYGHLARYGHTETACDSHSQNTHRTGRTQKCFGKAVTTEDTIRHLNDLTETCKDGELGCRTVAENARNTQLESVFTDYSKQRGHFARALQGEVERLGGTSTDSGTATATVFRGWINLKSALSGDDGGALIAACETGEENAVGAFELVANMRRFDYVAS
jgi:uncharacterized protein (TIGR02284 family)